MGLVQSEVNHDNYFNAYISVYVRLKTVEVNKWHLKFLENMGAQTHVQCQCNKMPLIPTHCRKEKKLLCTEIINGIPCHRKEAFVCSNISCSVRRCSRCYKSYPKGRVTCLATSRAVSDNRTSSIPDHHEEEEDSDGDHDDDGDVESNKGTVDDEESLNPVDQFAGVDAQILYDFDDDVPDNNGNSDDRDENSLALTN